MKRKLKLKNIFILFGIILALVIGILLIVLNKPQKKQAEKNETETKTETKVEPEKEPEVPKEKVDIIDINSKTRPIAVSVNNTPVAVKVQNGLNKAYLVYELPTEGSTSRLLALYKDVENTKVGTVRSARHNFIDFAYESDAIFAAFGWSHYAQDQMQQGIINYVQGIVGEGKMYRSNPEHLASEHTVYLETSKVRDYAINTKKYKKESDNTILLNYNVADVDLSTREDAKVANEITLPYGNIVTKFKYNSEKKEYQRVVNGTETKDYYTKEKQTTKNIIVEKLTYNMMGDNYYWNLHTTGNGTGYYITNGYAVPIKWSKKDRKSKTKYTYNDGKEIEVSDGRTYIEVMVNNTSIK